MGAIISEKYLAGFLDADGSITHSLNKQSKRLYLRLEFSQRADRAEVLRRIQETYGGRLWRSVVKDREYDFLSISGAKVPSLLSRIQKHLVIKRHYAGIVLDNLGKKISDHEEMKVFLKEERKRKSLPIPVHPSRRWLAGYFDGDGCLSGSLLPSGTARVRAHIGAWKYDVEGIELIHKAFGGSYRHQGENFQWYMDMDASKAIKFLDYFTKHLIVKRNHADVVLGHARSKHFRDGKEMVGILKALNAKPQRLSESAPAMVKL